MTFLDIVDLIIYYKAREKSWMNRKNGEEKVRNRRISWIDEQIRSGKYPNAKILAVGWGVSQRTILRDIEYMINELNAPIEYNYFKKGFYYDKPNFFIKSVFLTEDEFVTITGIDNNLKDDGGYIMLDEKLRRIFDKIFVTMPEERTKNLHFSPSNNDNFGFEPNIKFEFDILTGIHPAI
jgi:predicted DNA-binding transcriptional regulator YafY